MENRSALWAVAVPLLLFKLWVSLLIYFSMPTRPALDLLLATGWPWILALIFLVAMPALAWWRLVRVRARRRALQRSEWMGAEPASSAAPADAADQWPLWETVSRLERGD